jgi:hypothetical protein
MAESASGLMTEVAALTNATTQLLNTVNVRKVTLDEKVDASAASAQASAQSAAASNDSANLAAAALSETEAARDTAQTYRDQAVAVVTSNDGSFDAAPGKVPVAGLDGKVDFDYLPLAQQNAVLAEAIVSATHENLRDFFDDREVKAQVQTHAGQITTLTTRVTTEVARLDQKIDTIEPGIPPAYQGLIEQDFLIDGFESAYTAEILRGMGGSGLYSTRNYSVDDGNQALHRPFTVTSTAQFQHNHPNYYRMVGLGELCAIVNGYYVRTTHNDPTLIDQDGRILSAPPVPVSVLAKPTGVSLNANGTVSIDTASDTQARYMRNLFTQHLEDTRLDLLYIEVWLEKLPSGGDLNTLISSFRHKENANQLRDLLNFAQKLNYSGAKDLPENGSFRCGVISLVNANGTPEYAYINYRLRARSVGKLNTRVPKTSYSTGDQTPQVSFSVVSAAVGGTHGHALDVPLTPAEMNSLIGGATLYIESSYNYSPASPAAENHSHLYALSWNGATLVATNLGARRPDDPANQFLAVSGTPSIASYRKADGSMAGPVVWSTVAVPHQHPMDVQTVQDRFPFDLHKAINHVIDNGNRFKLVKDVEALNRLRESGMPTAGWLQLAESGLARFTLDQDSMDAICAQVWGLDGEGAFIPEVIDSYGTNFTTYNVVGDAQANLAKYNRTYKIGSNDASGRTTARRGFSDPTLYVAKTTLPSVVEGYSFMIPLELIVRTPLEVWNPWSLNLIDGNPASGGSGAGTPASPWNAAYTQLWYNLLPPNFFSAGASDPADTTTGGVWIQASNGSAYPADNSGIFITIGGAADYRNPAGNVISTVFRQRYAIAPVWHEFTYANVQLNNFKNSVRALLKGIVSGSVSATDIDHIL